MYRIDQTLSRSYFMPYLVPLCLLMIAAPVMCAEDTTTEQSDNQQRDAINVLKRLKLLKPEAAKSLADSQVLEKAFRKMMVRFAKENAKDLGPKKVKQITTIESLTDMIKSLRRELPTFLRTIAQQERKWVSGEFDDRSAAALAKKIVSVLEDFDTSLPTVTVWAVKQIEDGKLRGAELEVATQMLMIPLAKLIYNLQE
jgi:hypothetical protein